MYRQLLRLSADDHGIEALGQALAQFSHKGVLIQDKRLQPLAQAPGHERTNWAELLEIFQLASHLPSELMDRKQAHAVREPILQADDGWARLLMPIVTRNVARGYVSF